MKRKKTRLAMILATVASIVVAGIGATAQPASATVYSGYGGTGSFSLTCVDSRTHVVRVEVRIVADSVALPQSVGTGVDFWYPYVGWVNTLPFTQRNVGDIYGHQSVVGYFTFDTKPLPGNAAQVRHFRANYQWFRAGRWSSPAHEQLTVYC